MRLSLVQITVGSQVEKTLKKLITISIKRSIYKPDLILLPGSVLFLSNVKKSFTMDHEYILHYQNFAKKNKIKKILGSLPILNRSKVYNRSIFINGDGIIASYYDKIHMFDVILKNNDNIMKSDTFTPNYLLSI